MIELKTEINGNEIKYFAEDEIGNKYRIKQLPTNIVYDEAIDPITNPNNYSYIATEEKIEEDKFLNREGDIDG